MSAPRVLQIPVRGLDEFVEVSADQLPEDPEDIIDILKAEYAPLRIWIQFALEYYKQGKVDQFNAILKQMQTPDIEINFYDQKRDRIQVYLSQAGHHLNVALRERDENQRKLALADAKNAIDRASIIDPMESATIVANGIFFLYQGDYDRALKQFDTGLQIDSKNPQALLGKACIEFSRGKYLDALDRYKRVLQNCPTCPANVRFGIGLCYYKLNNIPRARQAFERVLQLEPENVDAMIALGVLDINDDKVQPAMEKFTKALKIAGDNNAIVLNYIARHMFYRKDYQMAINLALNAYHKSKIPQVKAESCYYIAKSNHALGNFESAFSYYWETIQAWPAFPLGQFGIGQLYIYKDQPDQAIPHFQNVLAQYPDNFETLKILGSLYAEKGEADTALHYLKRANNQYPNDADVLISIGELEKKDLDGALDCLKKTVDIMNTSGKTVPAELWNNIGSIYHKMGHQQKPKSVEYYAQAKENYEKALATADASLDDFSNVDHVTIGYNIARLYEDVKDTEKAKKIYETILKSHPTYTDCILRLGCIADQQDDVAEATRLFKLASDIRPDDINPHALLGYMHLKRDEWNLAQEHFEHIQKKIDQNDTYTLLAMGHIFLSCSCKPEMKEKAEKFQQYALQFFEKVLMKDNKNGYATLGIGAYLADKGYFGEAREVFLKTQEAAPGMIPETYTNLAHLTFAQKQYETAAKMYESCLRKFYDNKEPRLYMCAARAYYECGRLEECKAHIKKALELNPNDFAATFDLGLTCQDIGMKVIMQNKKATLEELEKAMDQLNEAAEAFNKLASQAEKVKSQSKSRSSAVMITEKAVVYYNRLKTDFFSKAKARIEQAKQEEEEKKSRTAKYELEQQELERKRKEEEEEKARKQREEEERIRRAAEETERKMEELRQKWALEAARRSQAKAAESDEEAPLGEGEGAEGGEKPKKKKRRSKKAAAEGAEGEEGAPKPKKRRSKKAAAAAEGEEGAEGKGKGKGRKRGASGKRKTQIQQRAEEEEAEAEYQQQDEAEYQDEYNAAEEEEEALGSYGGNVGGGDEGDEEGGEALAPKRTTRLKPRRAAAESAKQDAASDEDNDDVQFDINRDESTAAAEAAEEDVDAAAAAAGGEEEPAEGDTTGAADAEAEAEAADNE